MDPPSSATPDTRADVSQLIRFGCFNLKGTGNVTEDNAVLNSMLQHHAMSQWDIIALQELGREEENVVGRLGVGDEWTFCGNKNAGVLFRKKQFIIKHRDIPDERVVCVVLAALQHEPRYEIFVASIHAAYSRLTKKVRLHNAPLWLRAVSSSARTYQQSLPSSPSLPELPILVGGDFNADLTQCIPQLRSDGWAIVPYDASERRIRSVIDYIVVKTNDNVWPTVLPTNCNQPTLADVVNTEVVNTATMTNHDPIDLSAALAFRMCRVDDCPALGRVAGDRDECEGCETPSCAKCFGVCRGCGSAGMCRKCLTAQTACGRHVCEDCSDTCVQCEVVFGYCEKWKSEECGCRGRVVCYGCYQGLCAECGQFCENCNEWFCSECFPNDECNDHDIRDENDESSGASSGYNETCDYESANEGDDEEDVYSLGEQMDALAFA